MKRKGAFFVIALLIFLIAGLFLWRHSKKDSAPEPPPLLLFQLKNRGHYYLNKKDKKEALRFFKMASELDPKDDKLRSLVEQLERTP